MKTSGESAQRELLARAQAGDAAAFAELVRQYRGLVFSVCFQHTGNFGDSEDVTQEVLLTAHRSLSSLQEPAKLAGWLGGIARNLSLMHLRRSRRETPLSDADATVEAAADNARSLEFQNLVHHALLRVSECSREVLSLHYLGGYSYTDIAELCELPVQVVRSRLHEGREQLKARLLDVVANFCECSRNPEHTTECVLERCGAEACGCVTRLMAV
jgi:RNA polymerase sigma-70 factor, ECF subfamily